MHRNLAELTEDIVHDLQGRTMFYICIIKYQKDYLRDPSSSAGDILLEKHGRSAWSKGPMEVFSLDLNSACLS
jgi:hypothetical protein